MRSIHQIGKTLFPALYLKNTSGAIMPLTAFLLPVILGLGGLTIDVSNGMMTRDNLQTAADAAAVAGAWEVARGFDEEMEPSAEKEAENNGYLPALAGVINVTLNEAGDEVIVSIQQHSNSYFSRLFTEESTTVRVEATASVVPGTDDFCILSLEQAEANALTTSGAVDLSMPDCGIAVNSADGDAMHINGNVSIDVETISIVGEMSVSGGSADVTYDTLNEHSAPVPDPYATLDPAIDTACDYNNKSISGGGNKTLSPGTYCGGLRVRGNNNVTFEPGVYTFVGGAIDIAGGGTLNGAGTSFIMTGSGSDYATMSITGNRAVNLSAPAEGSDMEGILMYQDPNAPETGTNSLLGTADLRFDGVLYFPSQTLNIGGNSTAASDVCTKIVARVVRMHGNPFIGNDCSDKPIDPITVPKVKLIR